MVIIIKNPDPFQRFSLIPIRMTQKVFEIETLVLECDYSKLCPEMIDGLMITHKVDSAQS